MPAPRDVDREQVKMLVLAVGVREAARQMGIPEPTVQAWSARGNWLADTRPTPPKAMKPPTMRGATVATKPSDALENVLRDEGHATKIAGMRYARRTVEAAADMAIAAPLDALALAGDVKQAMQTGAIAGSWRQAAAGPHLALSIFNVSGAMGDETPVVDV